jgi:hypothetical protein
MKKIAFASTLLVLSLALVGLAATGALAATDKPQSSVTGTIVKMTSDDLFLQTDQGQLKFDFNKQTIKPDGMAVGNKVTIWYDSDDTGKHELDARTIQTYTEPAPPPTSQVTTPPPAPVETPPAQTTTPPQETQTTQEQPLPKTASPLPLVGAVGLLSLLGSGLLLRQPK